MSYRFIRTSIAILAVVLSLSIFSPALAAHSGPAVDGPTADTFEETRPSSNESTLEALWGQLTGLFSRIMNGLDPLGLKDEG